MIAEFLDVLVCPMPFEMCDPVTMCKLMGGGDCAVTLKGQSILSRKLLDVTFSDKVTMYPILLLLKRYMYGKIIKLLVVLFSI